MFNYQIVSHIMFLTNIYIIKTGETQQPTCVLNKPCIAEVELTWNKTSVTAVQLHRQFCPQRCPNETESGALNQCFDVDCFPCSCELPQCEIYGICCPDVLRDDGPLVDSMKTNKIEDEQKQLHCRRVRNIGILFIRSCLQNYTNDTVRDMCQTDEQGVMNVLEAHTRVSDRISGVGYYNMYCAICNNVLEFESWQITVDCSHYLNVYKALDEADLLRMSLQHDSDCIVRATPPNDHYFQCDTLWFQGVIDSCNTSGQWLKYDWETEHNCLHQFKHITSRMRVGSTVYKNIFCALCNSASLPCISDMRSVGNRFLPPLPFTLILNPAHLLKQKLMRNKIAQKDIQRQCILNECPLIHCSDGKIIYNGNCISPLTKISGLGYRFKLVFEYQNMYIYNVSTGRNLTIAVEDILESWNSWITGLLEEWSNSLSVKACVRVDSGGLSEYYVQNSTISDNWTHSKLYKKFLTGSLFSVDVYFVANDSYGRDEVEEYLTRITAPGVIELNFTGVSITLRHLTENVFKMNLSCEEDEYIFCQTSQTSRSSDAKGDRIIRNNKILFLSVSPFLTCPHVILNGSYFTVDSLEHTDPWQRQIKLKSGGTTLQFSGYNDLTRLELTRNNTLILCVDILKDKLAQSVDHVQFNITLVMEYVLTLFCLGVSMLCLVLIIITYLAFPVLRNMAGVHNIFLSSSLLLSQVLLLVSSHVHGPSIGCTVLGVVTHFSWLNMFCWSLFCCYHVYSIFNSQTRAAHITWHQIKSVMIFREVLSLLVPGVIVATVIVSDYLLSDGQSMGYGNVLCYLNSANYILYSFVAPLVCVLLINAFFFTSSVYQVCRLRKLQSNVNFRLENRKQMCVYIKLSTMTGLFWGLAILSEVLDSEPLRFVSVILNGLQGLFLFISYICNRRVMTLYRQWFDQLVTPPATDTSAIDHVIFNFNNH